MTSPSSREPTRPTALECGPLLARFATDPQDQLALARVRAASAALAVVAAVALLLGRLPLPVFLVALLALLISVAWLAQARSARRVANRATPEVLAVHARGFAVDEGVRTHWVPWNEVEAVSADEERLDVVVQRRSGPAVRLVPRYPGVDLYELVRTLDDARRAAHGRDELLAP